MITPTDPEHGASPVTCRSSLVTRLHEHLAWWGLKKFTSDADYFAWQRQQLSSTDLHQLNAHIERKRAGDPRDEVAFYDHTAQAHLLAALYSERYEYYGQIAPRVVARIGDSQSILDFGCGVGILATFYAKQFPCKQFVGVDRSPDSVDVAQRKARELDLSNVRFECLDVVAGGLVGSYDLVVATHAMLQTEKDPGIPSRSWQTFERARDDQQQADFEQRTGVGPRLDRLSAVLPIGGRMLAFEKARQLGRRVPFQRALAGRGLKLVDRPEPVRYQLVEEVVDDGPFYVLGKGEECALDWDESPEPDEGLPLDPVLLHAASSRSDQPLYENHGPSAQQAWERLNDRKIVEETTREEPDGRQLHVEFGNAEGLAYLYCANSFDQRQLVIVEPARKAMLDAYYLEIVGERI